MMLIRLATFFLALLCLLSQSLATADPADGPDDEDICIQRELKALSVYDGKLDGRIGPATKAAAAKIADAKGWNLPPLTSETDDLWCDMLVADAIGLPMLEQLPHQGELFLSRYDEVESPDICLTPTNLLPYYQSKVLDQKPPVKVILQHGSGGEANTNLLEDMSGALMAYAPAAYLDIKSPGDDLIKAKLIEWAKVDALQSFRSLDGAIGSGQWFQVYQLLSTLMYASDAYRASGQFTSEDDALVTAWIGKLIERVKIGEVLSNREGAGGEQRVNNHNGRRAMIAALWAIENNDVGGFNRAVREGYVRFLRNMRDDGSLIDAERGAWALRYTAYHIQTMMALAEAAHHQGLDLYQLEIDGHSIEDAIRFMLDADDDNSLIYPYAKANKGGRPGPWANKKQDSDWKLQNEGEVFNRVAWMNVFAERFPDSDLTPRLLKIREQFYAATPITFMMDRAIGNVSCYWPALDKVAGPVVPPLSEVELEEITVDEVINNLGAKSSQIDTHFFGSMTATDGEFYRLDFYLRGQFDDDMNTYRPLRIMLTVPVIGDAASQLRGCGVRIDDARAQYDFALADGAYVLSNRECVNAVKTPSVEMLGVMASNLAGIAVEMQKLGKKVDNPQLRAFIKRAAEGKVSIKTR
jgi:hypothetical protein